MLTLFNYGRHCSSILVQLHGAFLPTCIGLNMLQLAPVPHEPSAALHENPPCQSYEEAYLQ